MSLNDRFSNIRNNVPASRPTSVQMVRANLQQQHAASAKNRRLAQQMENRPAVKAALKLKQGLQSNTVQQRLGNRRGSVRSRLGRSFRGGTNRGGRGNNTFRSNRGTTRGVFRGMVVYRGGGRFQRGGRLQQRGGRAQRGGLTQRGGGRNQGTYFSQQNRRGRSASRGRGAQTVNRGQGQVGGRGGTGPNRGRGRRWRGRGGRGRAVKPDVSREVLDNQLDAYMAKTKSSLDSDLEIFMSTD